LKRAARERKAQRDRKKAEDEQVDLGVRMRLLNMGMGEDEAAYLMRDYETRWTRDDVQLRVRRRVAMDEEDESSEDEQEDDEGEEDEDDEAMDEIHGLDNLLDDAPERDRDVFTGSSDHDQVDYDLRSSGASDDGMDDTLQTPRRTVSSGQVDRRVVAVLIASCLRRRDSRASMKRPSLREIPHRSKCYPLVKRTLPANVIYLLARYAAYRCQDQEDLLHCVLEGASIAIEEVSHVSRRANQLIRRSCLRDCDV
jgi:hypothetical protein